MLRSLVLLLTLFAGTAFALSPAERYWQFWLMRVFSGYDHRNCYLFMENPPYPPSVAVCEGEPLDPLPSYVDEAKKARMIIIYPDGRMVGGLGGILSPNDRQKPARSR